MRKRFMQWWWDFIPGKPRFVQNGVGRIGCLLAGHEHGRSTFCDWCGKQLDVPRTR